MMETCILFYCSDCLTSGAWEYLDKTGPVNQTERKFDDITMYIYPGIHFCVIVPLTRDRPSKKLHQSLSSFLEKNLLAAGGAKFASQEDGCTALSKSNKHGPHINLPLDSAASHSAANIVDGMLQIE